MAYSMTFDSLQEDLRSYLERGFTAESDSIVYNQLPRLINMAERQIARDLKVQGFIKSGLTNTAIGESVYEKPARWRETISVSIAGTPIFSRSFEYLRAYWPNPAQTATPQFYADYDYSHWLLAPTPAAVAAMEILYYELPPLLDSTNQTNWLSEYAPNLLLYGALLEATPFLKNDERISVWQGMYTRAAQSLSTEDMKKVLDRTSTRDRV